MGCQFQMVLQFLLAIVTIFAVPSCQLFTLFLFFHSTSDLFFIVSRDPIAVSLVGPLTILIVTHQNQENRNLINLSSTTSHSNIQLQGESQDEEEEEKVEVIEQHPTFSCTSVVKNIIQNIIEPKVLLSPLNHSSIQGILLLGPPGVGKSFAISAVKKICKDFCNVRVNSIYLNNYYH